MGIELPANNAELMQMIGRSSLRYSFAVVGWDPPSFYRQQCDRAGQEWLEHNAQAVHMLVLAAKRAATYIDAKNLDGAVTSFSNDSECLPLLPALFQTTPCLAELVAAALESDNFPRLMKLFSHLNPPHTAPH